MRRSDHNEMENGAQTAQFAHMFDERLLSVYEKASIERRIEMAKRHLRGILEASRKLRIPSRKGPPAQRSTSNEDLQLSPLLTFAREAVERQRGLPGLKGSVVNHVLDEVCRTYLWTNLSSLPAFHEISLLLPYWTVNRTLQTRLQAMSDFVVQQLLHGIVLSLQRVREEILAADEVYLAHCACRSAGIVDDLEQKGLRGDRSLFTILGEQDQSLLLDRIVERYESLDSDRLNQTTGERYRHLMDDLLRHRREGSEKYCLETLLRETYQEWEIIPVKPGFTRNWIRSLRNNRKCIPIDKELVYELLNIFFYGRGALFNSMKCVNTHYTICTCPTPENDGGCVLTNWFYYGGMNNSLIAADDHYGRLRDLNGKLLPCRYFPVRARRSCLGCGCNHSLKSSRNLTASLAEADELLAKHRSVELPSGDTR